MKQLHIAVETKILLVIKTGLHSVLSIAVGDTQIGFIHIEETMAHDSTTVTPFTSSGLLPSADCPGCAIKALFTELTGLSDSKVHIAEEVSTRFGLLATLLSEHRKGKHHLH